MAGLIVGVDGSQGSLVALDWAVEEARLRGDELTVVAVREVPEMITVGVGLRGAYAERLEEAASEHARKILDEALAAHADSGVHLTTEVLQGRAPAWPLVRRAADADMLVVGSRGLGNVRRLLLGSVSHQVAVHAETLVVVVPEPTEPDRRDDKIVVGVDGSVHARAALRRAAQEAALRNWELEVIVVPPPAPAMAPRSPSQAAVDATMWSGALWPDGPDRSQERQHEHDLEQAHWRHAAESHLADEIARIGHDHLPEKVTPTVIGSRHPARALLDVAAWARLLVVGRRGRGGFTGMVLGSVSQHCVRHATAPVMVVPPEPAEDAG